METQGHPSPGGSCTVLLLGAQCPDKGSWAATSEADKEILREGTGGILQDAPVGLSVLRRRACALGLWPAFLL